MCICFFQINPPGAPFPLIFAGNRDEFLSRESVTCHEWATSESSPSYRTFGGLDAVRGGTWLACSSNTSSFRFAVVHNIRIKHKGIEHSKSSRGDLPKNFVCGTQSAKEYAEDVCLAGSAYFGFTLVIADETGVFFTSNANTGVIQLREGIYSISNALLDTPWPKVVLGKELFRKLLAKTTITDEEDEILQGAVSQVLRNDTLFPMPLPGILDPQIELLLSSVHINPFQWGTSWGFYGTRMQTVVLVRRDFSIRMVEHTLGTKENVHLFTGKWTRVDFDSRLPSSHHRVAKL